MAKNEKQSYTGTLAKVAPAFGLKAILGDLPKASLEHATEAKLRGNKAKLKDLLVQGMKGRGVGRATGAAVGIATAPLFLKGLDFVSSKDKKKQRLGLALLGSTAAAYQGQKGFIEGYRSAKAGGTPSKLLAARQGAIIGGTRIAYKTPSAILLGLSIAQGRKKSKSGGGPLAKYITPALSGAAIGALSRGAENIAVQKGMGGAKLTSQVFKKALPAAGGGAVGGLVGGVVLSAAVDGAMKALKSGKEKKAAAVTGTALGVKGLASLLGIHGATKGAMGYGGAGRLTAKIPWLGKRVQGGMQNLKTRELAIGIREGLAGRTNAGFRANVGLGMTIPELKFNREVGIKLGQLLRGVPPEFRPKALAFVQKQITPIMKKTKGGDPVPVFNQLGKAIEQATGKDPLFKRTGLAGAWNSVMHGGRGAYTQKGHAVRRLPKALAQDPKSKGLAGDLVLSGGGVGGMAALLSGAVPGAAVIPATVMASHAAMSGLKGLAVRTKAIQNKAGESAAQGIREAFLPGMRKGLGTKTMEKVLDYGVSPASRDFGKMIGALARRGAETGRQAFYGGAQGKLNRVFSPKRLSFSDAATMPMLAGAGAAGLYKANRER